MYRIVIEDEPRRLLYRKHYQFVASRMRHIKEILAEREQSLFGKPEEKGSREWSAFNIVREDVVDSYRVAQPRRPIVLREPHHVLRIVYPQSFRFHGVH